MRIFVIPQKTNSNSTNAFSSGISHLETLGHSVTFYDSKKDYSKELSNCDVVIYDSLLSDFNSGFIVSKAISLKRIVLSLSFNDKASKIKFDKDLKDIDKSIKDEKYLISKEYNRDNVNDVLVKALKDVSSKLDSKFILIIPSEIDRYLTWASETKRLHKAQIVREALESVMKKDREYRDSLN